MCDSGHQQGAMKTATLVFYGVALGLLLVGLRELLSGFEENKCSMTYMFEYPEYRVSTRYTVGVLHKHKVRYVETYQQYQSRSYLLPVFKPAVNVS